MSNTLDNLIEALAKMISAPLDANRTTAANEILAGLGSDELAPEKVAALDEMVTDAIVNWGLAGKFQFHTYGIALQVLHDTIKTLKVRGVVWPVLSKRRDELVVVLDIRLRTLLHLRANLDNLRGDQTDNYKIVLRIVALTSTDVSP